MAKVKKYSVALLVISLFLLGAVASCSKKDKGTTSKGDDKGKVAAVKTDNYVVMEKILSDQPKRPRTTMKIVVSDTAANSEEVLKAALESARKQDTDLKAVIIWAYRTRAELNGSNYTVGKLEWSADGKDYTGTKPLSPNPKVDISKK